MTSQCQPIALLTLPARSLRQPSQRVGIVTDDIKQLAEDMKTVTLQWEAGRQHEVGVALAAPQVNRQLKLIVVREDFNNKQNRRFLTLINPRITKREGQPVSDYEGCLSIRDVYGHVPRYPRVRVQATDLAGRPLSLRAEGFMARVLQHEIDHTRGILFIDHIKDRPGAFFRLTADGRLQSLNDNDVRQYSDLWQ